MVFITNKVVNYSNNDVWCCYSAENPSGGPDIWKVRLLSRNTRTEYAIDVDYIQADGGTINGKTGWWKLKQAGSFWIANNTNGGLTLGGTGGIPPWRAIFYYFEDWAKNTDGQSDQQIKDYLDEWEKLKDRTLPLVD